MPLRGTPSPPNAWPGWPGSPRAPEGPAVRFGQETSVGSRYAANLITEDPKGTYRLTVTGTTAGGQQVKYSFAYTVGSRLMAADESGRRVVMLTGTAEELRSQVAALSNVKVSGSRASLERKATPVTHDRIRELLPARSADAYHREVAGYVNGQAVVYEFMKLPNRSEIYVWDKTRSGQAAWLPHRKDYIDSLVGSLDKRRSIITADVPAAG